jgi:hypothetical protein
MDIAVGALSAWVAAGVIRALRFGVRRYLDFSIGWRRTHGRPPSRRLQALALAFGVMMGPVAFRER